MFRVLDGKKMGSKFLIFGHDNLRHSRSIFWSSVASKKPIFEILISMWDPNVKNEPLCFLPVQDILRHFKIQLHERVSGVFPSTCHQIIQYMKYSCLMHMQRIIVQYRQSRKKHKKSPEAYKGCFCHGMFFKNQIGPFSNVHLKKNGMY